MPENKTARRRSRRPRRQGKKVPLYAAVDLGTNNCRLLIARRHADTFQVIDSYSNVVRLGEGLSATGMLSDAAMARAMIAFRDIKEKLKHHRVGKVRCIATAACRRAANGAEFIAKVRNETGLGFKIIGAREEAQLAAIGCHDLYEEESDLVMVLDIGGGSTEIAFIELGKLQSRSIANLAKHLPVEAWNSFPIGVVTLTESFTGLSEADHYSAMLGRARELLSGWPCGADYLDAMSSKRAYIVGTSGTVTCLAGIHLGLERYRRDRVDGIWMSTSEVKSIIEHVGSVGREGRLALPTVGEERADLMMAGCAILEATFETWPTERLRVADRGLREGLLLSMMHGPPTKRRRKRRRKKPPHSGAQQKTQTVETGAAGS